MCASEFQKEVFRLEGCVQSGSMGLSLTASSYETVWMGLQLWLYLQSQSALANRNMLQNHWHRQQSMCDISMEELG